MIPAAYLLIEPHLPGGGGCPGGTCIADAFMMIPALGIGLFALGFLAGGVLVRFGRTSPRAEAGANAVGNLAHVIVVSAVIAVVALVVSRHILFALY
jgi:hypothetical protein